MEILIAFLSLGLVGLLFYSHIKLTNWLSSDSYFENKLKQFGLAKNDLKKIHYLNAETSYYMFTRKNIPIFISVSYPYSSKFIFIKNIQLSFHFYTKVDNFHDLNCINEEECNKVVNLISNARIEENSNYFKYPKKDILLNKIDAFIENQKNHLGLSRDSNLKYEKLLSEAFLALEI
jgi:hypothetical protein